MTEPQNDSDPLPINHGGLFRCCVETWREIAPPARMTSEGDLLSCSYCDGRMIVRDGAWRWDRDKP